MSKQKGFTLVELLVVISIIALLLALLMPALQRARGQARSIVCKSGLKQLGLVFNLYADDYDGHFPWNMASHPESGWIRWFHFTSPSQWCSTRYGGPKQGARGLGDPDAKNWQNFYICPSAKIKKLDRQYYSYVPNFFVLTSSRNSTFSGGGSLLNWPDGGRSQFFAYSRDQFKRHSNTPLVMDGQVADGSIIPGADTLYPSIQPVVDSGYWPWGTFGFMEQIGRMHNGKGNFCFLDMHVSTVPYTLGEWPFVSQWYKDKFNWMPGSMK